MHNMTILLVALLVLAEKDIIEHRGSKRTGGYYAK